jgi:hypothetical protein
MFNFVTKNCHDSSVFGAENHRIAKNFGLQKWLWRYRIAIDLRGDKGGLLLLLLKFYFFCVGNTFIDMPPFEILHSVVGYKDLSSSPQPIKWPPKHCRNTKDGLHYTTSPKLGNRIGREQKHFGLKDCTLAQHYTTPWMCYVGPCNLSHEHSSPWVSGFPVYGGANRLWIVKILTSKCKSSELEIDERFFLWKETFM